MAQALVSLGISLCFSGAFEEADAVLSEGLAHARAGGKAFNVSQALLQLGNVSRQRMHDERAAALFLESVAIARTIERASDRAWMLVGALTFLGRVVSEHGNDAEAMVLFKEALGLIREAGIAGSRLSHCLNSIAAALSRTGDALRGATLFGAAETERGNGVMRYPFDERSASATCAMCRPNSTNRSSRTPWRTDGQ